ncbi:MAG: hypothetical protein KY462_00165 [Actinobacteria bacterium]|nr:hypothetical protein [Actinomycetota bacterium]
MELTERFNTLNELYSLLHAAATLHGGPRLLGEATGRDGWPTHGVYFFFESGELREDGETPRVVRVGTHALSESSKTRLWTRLRAHKGRVGGRNPGGGNHRGSVFRLHVGTALIQRDGYPEAATSWASGSSAPRDVRDKEMQLERAVSRHIGAMSVVHVAVPDRGSRAAIESGCISLLSNFDREPMDPPSRDLAVGAARDT